MKNLVPLNVTNDNNSIRSPVWSCQPKLIVKGSDIFAGNICA